MKPHVIAVSMAVAVVLNLFASIGQAATRDEVIDAYIEWRGGAAYTTMENMVRQGTIEVSGLEGTVQLIQTRNGERRIDVDLDVVEYAEALSPEDGWIQNTSGQIETMGQVLQTLGHRELALIFGSHLVRVDDNITHLGEETHDGHDWEVIRISYGDGDSHDLFIEEETGAMEWVRVTRDTNVFWQRWTEWDVLDGVRLPGRQAELHDNPIENQVFNWQESGLNIPLPPSVFERPSTVRSVQFAGDATTTGWLDFDFFRRQRIFLPTTVNGVQTFSVLDSGAEMTVIDTALAEQMGLVGVGTVAATGTGGTTEVQFAAGVSIEVGNITLVDMTVAILDLSDVGRRLLNGQLPMILGKELFNETVVDIDYPNARIAFHHPDHWSYSGDGANLALPDLEGSRSVPLGVDGVEIITSFDIGQGTALTLFEAYVENAGLLDGRPTSTRLGGGVGGEVTSTLIAVEQVEFGGTVMRNVPTALSLNNPGAFDTTREQGNLGTDIFSRFRMIVDYGSDQIYLEPDTALVAAPFDFDHAGAQLQPNGDRAEVIHLMAGSPAAASELEVGDVVIAINGRAIGEDYWTGDLWRWAYAAPGTEAVLTLLDGSTITLTLARFY